MKEEDTDMWDYNNIPNIGTDGIYELNNTTNMPTIPYEAVVQVPSGTDMNIIPDGLYILNNDKE